MKESLQKLNYSARVLEIFGRGEIDVNKILPGKNFRVDYCGIEDIPKNKYRKILNVEFLDAFDAVLGLHYEGYIFFGTGDSRKKQSLIEAFIMLEKKHPEALIILTGVDGSWSDEEIHSELGLCRASGGVFTNR